MSTSPDQFFSRIAGKVNLRELTDRLVVIVGVGSVGSQIARELAYSGVGNLRLIDGGTLQESNLIRHALPRKWLERNKAEALTLHLAGEVPTVQITGLDRNIDDTLADGELDELIGEADLIVAATDDRRTQRRLGARARSLRIAAVFPGLYDDDGGEVFVQRRADLPCFSCWDGFRPADAALRGATALNADTLPVLSLTVELCLGLLDRDSAYFRRLVPPSGEQLPILFRLAIRDTVVLGVPTLEKRWDCPVCGRQARSQSAVRQSSPPESLGHMTPRWSWRGVAVILTLCAMTVLFFRAASIPFLSQPSGGQSTRSAPAGTELAVLERIAKEERISDESVDNRDAMIEKAVKLEPSRWFKPCRFGTPVTADTPVKTYTCVTNGVSSTLEYFAEPNEVQGALLKRAWEVGAVRPKATCPDGAPALQEYGLGYVLCFIRHEHLYYAWTNSTGYEVRYTEARFPRFDPGAAQQWWNEANEEVRAHWIPRY